MSQVTPLEPHPASSRCWLFNRCDRAKRATHEPNFASPHLVRCGHVAAARRRARPVLLLGTKSGHRTEPAGEAATGGREKSAERPCARSLVVRSASAREMGDRFWFVASKQKRRAHEEGKASCFPQRPRVLVGVRDYWLGSKVGQSAVVVNARWRPSRQQSAQRQARRLTGGRCPTTPSPRSFSAGMR